MSDITAPDDAFAIALESASNPEWNSTVKVWHEGQQYDPQFESYRPKYAYLIETPEWQYFGNDISGACNETPNVLAGAQSLFAFLYACQESHEHTTRTGLPGENNELFPQHVAEWAYLFSDEIGMHAMQLEEINSEGDY